ncbi:MAG: RNA polymerase sigma factor [Sphingomonadaceae bacterium]
MSSGGNQGSRPLALVSQHDSTPAARMAEPGGGPTGVPTRQVDWSILMAHAQGGDQRAYGRLLEEIAPYVRSLAAKAHRDSSDIEDAVQDVLLTVHAVRHTYDPTRPFGPWLVAIANRRITDRLRRQGRFRARETPLTEEHVTSASTEANYSHDAASAACALRDAIERLPRGQRDALRLLKLQELSLKEAAAASGTSVAALKVATHRAVKNLRKIFGQPGDET